MITSMRRPQTFTRWLEEGWERHGPINNGKEKGEPTVQPTNREGETDRRPTMQECSPGDLPDTPSDPVTTAGASLFPRPSGGCRHQSSFPGPWPRTQAFLFSPPAL